MKKANLHQESLNIIIEKEISKILDHADYLAQISIVESDITRGSIGADGGQQSSRTVMQAFLGPFKDVVDTAKYGLEKTATVAMSNLGKLTKMTAMSFIPFTDIKKIEEKSAEKLKANLSKIDSKYKGVLERNMDALERSDMWGFSFAFFPQAAFTAKAAMKAPQATLAALDIATGGKFETITKLSKALNNLKMDPFAAANASKVPEQWTPAMDISGGGGMGEQAQPQTNTSQVDSTEKIVLTPEQKNAKFGDADYPLTPELYNRIWQTKVTQLLANPQIQNAIDDSPQTKQIKAAAQNAIVDTLKDFLNFSTIEGMSRIFGSGYQTVIDEVSEKIPPEATEEQKKEFWDEVIRLVKENVKELYLTQIKSVIGNSEQAHAAFEEVIEKIKNL